MAEDTTSTPPSEDGAQTGESTEAGGERAFTQADVDRIVSERVTRERAKYADYGDLKKKAAAAMTEQERAVTEAEARGRADALATAGKRLALAEFRAAAAGTVEADTLAGFLEYADMGRFVGDDGEPDAKAIAAAVKRLGGTRGSAPDFDGGARSTPPSNDMNSLIRRQAGVG